MSEWVFSLVAVWPDLTVDAFDQICSIPISLIEYEQLFFYEILKEWNWKQLNFSKNLRRK